MIDQLLTSSEVAKILRISKPTLFRIVHSGRLRVIRVTKRKWRFRESDVLTLLTTSAKEPSRPPQGSSARKRRRNEDEANKGKAR